MAEALQSPPYVVVFATGDLGESLVETTGLQKHSAPKQGV